MNTPSILRRFPAAALFCGAAFAVLALTSAPAHALPRDCPSGSQWSTSEESCVKIKKARKRSPEQTYQAALRDLDQSNPRAKPKRGVARAESACRRGHAKSCSTLAYLYHHGRFVTASRERAEALYRQACTKDHARGCIGAAELLSSGKPADHKSAVPLLTRACSLGSGRGCYQLARKYDKALGVRRNQSKANTHYRKAVELLRKACPTSAAACETLGTSQYNGRGTRRDRAAAMRSWQRGCDGGAGSACYYVAEAYKLGHGATKDRLRAKEFYEKACYRYDIGRACRDAGFMMLRWAKAARDSAALLRQAKRACRLDRKSCDLYGQLYATGAGVGKDQRLASKYFRDSCEAGDAESCAISGVRFDAGTGVPKNRQRAIALWDRACNLGWAKACRYLGKAYRVGDGVAKNADKALRKYQLGCIRDDASACTHAGDMIDAGEVKSSVKKTTYFSLACSLKDGWGCRRLSIAHKEAKTSTPAKRRELFERACGYGDHTSCKVAGEAYYNGNDVAVDKAAAAEWFAKACRHGNAKTCWWVDQAFRESAAKPLAGRVALSELSAGCDAGRSAACLALGQIWIYGGHLDTKQIKRGVDLYRKRCDGGDPQACLRVGLLYAQGIGVIKDNDKAQAMFRKECERNTPGACNRLGLDLWERDKYEAALTLFTRACEEKDGLACNVEAFAYYTAKGRRWNVHKAVELYQKACEYGHELACANVGELFRLGVVLEKNAEKSLEASRKACTPTEMSGCTWVGRAYHKGTGVDKDLARAEAEYSKTCNDESWASAESCLFLAELYSESGRDPSRAASLRQRAFQLATTNADKSGYYHHLLGVMYLRGIATMEDPGKAAEHFAKGCDAYDPQSCRAGGDLLLVGSDGVAADRKRALFMLERACAAAYQDSCAVLERAKTQPKAKASPATVSGKKGCGGCSAGGQGGSALVWLVVVALVWRRRQPRSV